MTVIGFPGKEWTKPKTLEDWPWDTELGKPYQDINCGPVEVRVPSYIGEAPPERPEIVGEAKAVINPPMNDLARYKDASPAAQLLHEACDLIEGDRATQNGNKLKNHQNIADHWNAYLGNRLLNKLTPKDVALMMVELKIARTKCGAHNPDDYRDMIGYGSIAGEFAAND